MGLLLDSSVLIAADRRQSSAAEMLDSLLLRYPGEDLRVSAITVAEFAHGTVRAEGPLRQRNRQLLLSDVMTALDIVPVTASIALRAGILDGQLAAAGTTVALSDLLIGATALELGYGVVTANLRHFRRIPDLRIVQQ